MYMSHPTATDGGAMLRNRCISGSLVLRGLDICVHSPSVVGGTIQMAWVSCAIGNVCSWLLLSMDLRVVVDLESTLFFWRYLVRACFSGDGVCYSSNDVRGRIFKSRELDGEHMAIDLIGVSVHELIVGVFLRGLCYLNAFFWISRFERSFVVHVNGDKNESKQTKLVSKKSSPNQRTQPTHQTYQKNEQRHSCETYV